jgi:hypothetical protein
MRLLLLATLIVVTPWVMRNWAEVGAPVVVTNNGFNLHAEYHPRPTRKVVSSTPCSTRSSRFSVIIFTRRRSTTLRRRLAQLSDHPLDPLRVVRGNPARG